MQANTRGGEQAGLGPATAPRGPKPPGTTDVQQDSVCAAVCGLDIAEWNSTMLRSRSRRNKHLAAGRKQAKLAGTSTVALQLSFLCCARASPTILRARCTAGWLRTCSRASGGHRSRPRPRASVFQLPRESTATAFSSSGWPKGPQEPPS
jgi:hypothetical protein